MGKRVREEVRSKLRLEGNPNVCIVSIDAEACRRARCTPDEMAQRMANRMRAGKLVDGRYEPVSTRNHAVYHQALELVQRKLDEMTWLASVCVVNSTRAMVQYDEPVGLTGKRVTRTRYVRVLLRKEGTATAQARACVPARASPTRSGGSRTEDLSTPPVAMASSSR